MDDNEAVRLERDGDDWQLACVKDRLVAEANQYLGYLADRNYSPRTIRAYGHGRLACSRWLHTSGLTAQEVSTDDVLAFLPECRQERVKGRPGTNVIDLNANRTGRLALGSINVRLAAVAGLYEYLMKVQTNAVEDRDANCVPPLSIPQSSGGLLPPPGGTRPVQSPGGWGG